jgi:hypothetical protein
VSGHGGSSGERLLHYVPYFAGSVDHDGEYRYYQTHTAPRYCMQLAYRARDELRSVQRHLPSLSATYSRLFSDIRYCRPKIVHVVTAGDNAGTLSRSLS